VNTEGVLSIATSSMLSANVEPESASIEKGISNVEQDISQVKQQLVELIEATGGHFLV
jgi:phage shock protein A